MGKTYINVLIVDDDEQDFIYEQELIHQIDSGFYKVDWVSDFDKAIDQIKQNAHDVYLIDYNLGASSGIDLIKKIEIEKMEKPFIFLTGAYDLRIDKEAMELGIIDYLVKGEITPHLIEKTIRYAIKQKASEIELKKNNATKDKLFSIISHDLKSPYNSILGLSNALVNNYAQFTEEETINFLKTINAESEKAYTYLINILNWSRTQLNCINPKFEKFNVCDLVHSLVNNLNTIAKNKHINMSCGQSGQNFVNADYAMVETVFRNIITNSIKFTNAGGEIHLQNMSNSKEVIISIRDNGVGMDQQTINNIWKDDSYQSIRGTNHEKGTGLGLKIAKEFIELNQGHITVKSTLNEGTEFQVFLPRITN